jgi:hypothetical protein
MLRRGEGGLTGSYVWPFDSNPWSMTSLYRKGLQKNAKLGNVMFKKVPYRIMFFLVIGTASLKLLHCNFNFDF